VPSDFALAYHASELVLDRELLIIAAADGALTAVDVASGATAWSTIAGAGWASPPVIAGDDVAALRVDGTLLVCAVESGEGARSLAAGSEVVAAWPLAEGLQWFDAGALRQWSQAGLLETALPGRAVNGGAGFVVLEDGAVWWIDGDGALSESGLMLPPAAVRAARLLRWGDSVVDVGERQLRVYGRQPYVIERAAAVVSAAVVADHLLVASEDGRIAWYRGD
jgi:hypothetical protein